MKKYRHSFLKYNSIIKRNTNKFFDIKLAEKNIGSGQQFFLIRIYENSGISMNALAKLGGFDKATVTKAVKRLLEEGYVRQENDIEDGRVKRLYVTDAGMEVIDLAYEVREEWLAKLTENMEHEDIEKLHITLEKLAEISAREIKSMKECKESDK